ncbi:hypothetical protein DRQ25_15705 [Candidatus Fermentibacteria bacterium]|nr:MAG: hypothetical protein DRQ25_15705 [Candidatus Fermentibacteria bacterium]
MSNFDYKFTNLASPAKSGSITPTWFRYKLRLNALNSAIFFFDALDPTRRSLIVEGGTVEIKRNGSLSDGFVGVITQVDYLDAGGVKVRAVGKEAKLLDEVGSYSNSPYTNTASATIASDIIGESSVFSAGTIEAGSNIDFRISSNENLWDALLRLTRLVGQDVSIDYSSDEIDVLDHKGSSTSVMIMNDNKEIRNIVVSKGRPQANYVVVKGKGDGNNQISSDPSSHGTDATSQAKYGVIKKIITNRMVMSEDEANKLADVEVARLKDPVKIYSFQVVNPQIDIVPGDVITLNSSDKGLNSEQVRVTKVERGLINGYEILELDVSNSAYATAVKNRDEVLNSIKRSRQKDIIYMQGSTNIISYPFVGNGDSSTPMDFWVYVPAEVEDESGNVRLNAVTLTYSCSDYKQDTSISGSVSSASSGTSMNNAKKGASDTGYYYPNTAASYTADISSVASNTWHSVSTAINVGSSPYLFHGITGAFTIDLKDTSGTDTYKHTWIYIRAKNTTDTTYFPSSYGVKISYGYSIKANGVYTLTIPFYLHIPQNWSNKTYVLQYFITGGISDRYDSDGSAIQQISYQYFGSEGHTHSNSISDPNHNHDDSFTETIAVSLNATSATDTVIKIDNSSGTELWDSGNRGKIKEEDIDISSYLTGKGWYRIKIYPNSDARVHANVKIKTAVDA